MRFYLGTHMPSQSWWDLGVPLFVSTRRLRRRKRLPEPKASWALDSGAFTELDRYGEFRTSAAEYADEVRRYLSEMEHCEFVSPQDWMCEPFILRHTGLTLAEHQRRTVANFLDLRQRLGMIVVPVVQGWALDDYLRCVELYNEAGVALDREPLVGVGSVCRRQSTRDGAAIFRALAALGLRLHGYGVKIEGVAAYGRSLVSADSMAWSSRGRRVVPGCSPTHKNEANCPRFAVAWREHVLAELDRLSHAEMMERIGQLRLEVA